MGTSELIWLQDVILSDLNFYTSLIKIKLESLEKVNYNVDVSRTDNIIPYDVIALQSCKAIT